MRRLRELEEQGVGVIDELDDFFSMVPGALH
jgi:hypothetical protein